MSFTIRPDCEVGVDATREDGARHPLAEDPALAAAAGDRLAHLVEVGAGLGGERQSLRDPERDHGAHQVVRELGDLAVPDRADVDRAPERLQDRQAPGVSRVGAPRHDRQPAGPRRDRAAADRGVEDVDAAGREAARQFLRRRGLHGADQQERRAVAQARLEPVLAAERRLDVRRVRKDDEHDVAALRRGRARRPPRPLRPRASAATRSRSRSWATTSKPSVAQARGDRRAQERQRRRRRIAGWRSRHHALEAAHELGAALAAVDHERTVGVDVEREAAGHDDRGVRELDDRRAVERRGDRPASGRPRPASERARARRRPHRPLADAARRSRGPSGAVSERGLAGAAEPP